MRHFVFFTLLSCIILLLTIDSWAVIGPHDAVGPFENQAKSFERKGKYADAYVRRMQLAKYYQHICMPCLQTEIAFLKRKKAESSESQDYDKLIAYKTGLIKWFEDKIQKNLEMTKENLKQATAAGQTTTSNDEDPRINAFINQWTRLFPQMEPAFVGVPQGYLGQTRRTIQELFRKGSRGNITSAELSIASNIVKLEQELGMVTAAAEIREMSGQLYLAIPIAYYQKKLQKDVAGKEQKRLNTLIYYYRTKAVENFSEAIRLYQKAGGHDAQINELRKHLATLQSQMAKHPVNESEYQAIVKEMKQPLKKLSYFLDDYKTE